MRRTRTALATVAALGLAGLLAGPTPAQAAWKKLGCAPTEVRGAKICLYRSTIYSGKAQGRYINHSGFNLKTQGTFYRQDAVGNQNCAVAITEAGTTSRCTRTLDRGTYYLGAHTWKGDTYLGFTATDEFRFGQ
jgi:hypothetical protein